MAQIDIPQPLIDFLLKLANQAIQMLIDALVQVVKDWLSTHNLVDVLGAMGKLQTTS